MRYSTAFFLRWGVSEAGGLRRLLQTDTTIVRVWVLLLAVSRTHSVFAGLHRAYSLSLTHNLHGQNFSNGLKGVRFGLV